MSKKIKSEVEAPVEVAPEVAAPAKKAGRPAAPRDENGAIIRPEGWVKPERKGKVAPIALTFDEGVLKASTGGEFVNGAWTYNGVTAAQVASDLPAAVEVAEKAAQVLKALTDAQAALTGLPHPADKVARATLSPASLDAVIDYLSNH